jgi:hypothetical protein
MYGPNRQLVKIGRFPIVSPSNAREKAKTILAEEQLGIRADGEDVFQGGSFINFSPFDIDGIAVLTRLKNH